VVQESLTNCARHAHASNVRIAVQENRDWIWVVIQDDGKGFDRKKTGGRGFGLIGMEERIKKLGGAMEISSQGRAPLKGTILKVGLPISMEKST